MNFNQLLFPLVFLPVSLVLFQVTPGRFKKYALLALSLIFIAWGNPADLLLALLSTVFNWASCLELSYLLRGGRKKQARIALITAVAANLLMLGYFKYFNFAAESVAALFHATAVKTAMAPPVGISFFTFSVLSALFDVYRGKAAPPSNPCDFALFVTFFPKLVSGPIAQYHDFIAQINALQLSRERTEAGMRTFLVGLSKKVLLANTLGLTFNAVADLPTEDTAMLTAWIGALAYTFMLYFDFSGYSDMALGLGKAFGFDLPQNFNYPYCAESVSDFWRRWHVSLGAWFRDYVYIPLGGSRAGDAKTIRNLFVVWLLTGIWHGANWTFLVWGLYYGVLLVLEKFALRAVVQRLPAVVRRVLTFFLAVFGWVFFFSPDLASAFRYFGRMFAFGRFADGASLYYLGGFWLPLLLAVVGALPVVRNAALSLKKSKPRWLYPVGAAVFALLFLCCIAGMVSDTYTSFLYAQF